MPFHRPRISIAPSNRDRQLQDLFRMSNNDRKRQHQRWNPTKQKSVEAGVDGLLFTCDGIEKAAVNEAYNLIDELMEGADQAGTAETGAGDSDGEEDIADSLKRQCAEGRNQKTRRCKQRPTGVKNVLFINVKGGEPVSLASRMVSLAQSAPRCRHLQRVLPVEHTADVALEKMNDIVVKLVTRHLALREDGTHPTYALDFKARNNDQIKRDQVLEMLNDAVTAIAPAAKVNLSAPEVTLVVQVVRKTIMGGAAFDFIKMRKYSLRPAEEKEQDKKVNEVKTEEKEQENKEEEKKTDVKEDETAE